MTNLELIKCTAVHLQKLIEGSQAFQSCFGIKVIPGYLEFPESLEYSLKQLQEGSLNEKWGSYMFIHKTDNALIGFGGYKFNPNSMGDIEIGYCISPDYRGRGFATEAALKLVNQAFESPEINIVSAHTLPELNNSCKCL